MKIWGECSKMYTAFIDYQYVLIFILNLKIEPNINSKRNLKNEK